MPRPADAHLERLIPLLVCPTCRGELTRRPAPKPALDCPACGLRFPIRDGIPRMAPEEAERLR